MLTFFLLGSIAKMKAEVKFMLVKKQNSISDVTQWKSASTPHGLKFLNCSVKISNQVT